MKLPVTTEVEERQKYDDKTQLITGLEDKLAILQDEFHCKVIQVKSFTTFIIVTIVTTNKSVHLIGHLPKGDNFT
jgi:ASC-1-like (ASCH) protein